jgi:hypothetical protein
MRHFLTLILIILFSASYAQDFVYPLIRSKGQSVADFVPVGWMILDSAYGDLNKDGIKDAAIIIQHRDSFDTATNIADPFQKQF